MTLQNFVNNSGPVIGAPWLNQVDVFVNTLFQAATTQAQALAALGITNQVIANSQGQCQFRYISGTQCGLYPYNGNLLWINGANYVLPAVTYLANTGLATSTVYYTYAYLVGSTVTLEAVTTAPNYTTASGIPSKTGDATRTLVGQVGIATGGTIFTDSATARLTLSWFNQRQSFLVGATVNAGPTNLTTIQELNAGARAAFIVWPNSVLVPILYCLLTNNTTDGLTYIYLANPSGTFAQPGIYQAFVGTSTGTVTVTAPLTGNPATLLYVTAYGLCSGSSLGTWNNINIQSPIWI